MKNPVMFATLLVAVFRLTGLTLGQEIGGTFADFDLRPSVSNRRYDDFREQIVKLKPFPVAVEEIDLELPSLFSFLCLYSADWNRQETTEQQLAFLRAARSLIVAVRTKHERANVIVIGPGRPLTALLHKEEAYAGGRLDLFTRKGLDSFAVWFGAPSPVTVFKPTDAEPAEATKTRFLEHVSQWLQRGAVGTLWINAHGSPMTLALDQDRGVFISVAELADAIAAGATGTGLAKSVDLRRTVWVFESCYSGNLIWNLIDEILRRSRDGGFQLLPPALIAADQTRGRPSREIQEEIIHAYSDRRPDYWSQHGGFRLTDFSGRVTRRLFWRGREAVLDPQTGQIIGARVVDADLLQQPVFVVPLNAEEQQEVRRILGPRPESPVRPFLEIR